MTPEHERDLLTFGDVTVEGHLAGSSNATLKVRCDLGSHSASAVYKPRRGERPLWDFPVGSLGHREVAMSTLDEILGWGLVPRTVWREEGPYGPGSCQLWVETDPDTEAVTVQPEEQVPEGWYAVAQGEGLDGEIVCLAHADTPALRRMALLDVLANNADRKGGHVLVTPEGAVAAIDHGLTFHVDDKLRTVLWGWAGSPLREDELLDLRQLADRLPVLEEALRFNLTELEVLAMIQRLNDLLRDGCFPSPSGAWPALPWPAM